MRDGSAPVGVNHMAVRKFKRSFFPRVTTRAGIRIEKGLLPWLPASKSTGSCQFMGYFFISTSGECKHGVVSRLGSSRLGLGGGLLALYNYCALAKRWTGNLDPSRRQSRRFSSSIDLI